jgi:hypothetical protein
MKKSTVVKIQTHHNPDRFDLWLLLEKGYHDGTWMATNISHLTGRVFMIEEWEFMEVK